MGLEIKKEIINNWFLNGRKGENILKELNLEDDLEQFALQLEQFILRGTDPMDEGETFDCIFPEDDDGKTPIDVKEIGDLHRAINRLGLPLKHKDVNPNLIIMCDSKTFEWRNKSYNNGITLKKRIKKTKGIKKWINLTYNTDSSRGDNRHFVCIANMNFLNIIEEKSPVNIVPNNDNILLYWCGALKIKDPDAIQRININYINVE